MAAEQYQRVYWLGSVVLLTFGGALICVAASFMRVSRNDTLYYAFIPMFIADISMIINFLMRDFYHLVADKLDTSGWCQFSAIWTIAACLALNINAIMVAYFTRELVFDRLVKEEMKKKVARVTIAAWVIGILGAVGFQQSNVIGNFKGIYCCFTQISSLNMALPFFLITSGATLTMIFFYTQAFGHVYASYRSILRFLPAGYNSGAKVQLPGHVRNLMYLSTYMVCSFYLCWSLVSFLAMAESAGAKYPVALDVLAGWLLKLQPTLDSILIIRSFRNSIMKQFGFSHNTSEKAKPHTTHAESPIKISGLRTDSKTEKSPRVDSPRTGDISTEGPRKISSYREIEEGVPL